MNQTRNAVVDRLTESGLDVAAVDTIVDVFVRFYRSVSEYNRVAAAAGQPAHPDSHPEREALARLLTDGEETVSP